MPETEEHTPLPPLRCAGIGLRGSGYPNAINTVRKLRKSGIEVDDRVNWLPESTQLWKATRGSLWSRVSMYGRLLLGNGIEAWRLCLTRARSRRITYVPYPAIFLLWWLSWVPSRWRPVLIADAYISIWDATVRDRSLLGKDGLASRFLHHFEGRALRAANAVLVDTQENRKWMIDSFGLNPRDVIAIPLAIDDSDVLEIPFRTPSKPLRVLYIGTFVPLHGIEVMVDAARLAQERSDIHFHFIGGGQDEGKLEALLHECKDTVTWEKGWLSHSQIVDRLTQHDVCLGVFGGSGKAGRVFPFKLYLTLAAGRAFVTQQEFSLPEGVSAPGSWTLASDPRAIVDQLVMLAENPERAAEAGRKNRIFYQQQLGDRALLKAWRRILLKLLGNEV